MQTIHKVALTDEERATVEKAMGILCDIAEEAHFDETGITAVEVFDYLFKKADINKCIYRERYTNHCTFDFDAIDIAELEDFEA